MSECVKCKHLKWDANPQDLYCDKNSTAVHNGKECKDYEEVVTSAPAAPTTYLRALEFVKRFKEVFGEGDLAFYHALDLAQSINDVEKELERLKKLDSLLKRLITDYCNDIKLWC